MIFMLVFLTVAVHNYMKTDIETTTEELIEKTEVIIKDIENTKILQEKGNSIYLSPLRNDHVLLF